MQYIPSLTVLGAQSALRFAPNLSGELESPDLLAQKGECNQVPPTINTKTNNKINSLAISASVLDIERKAGEKNIVVTRG